MKIFESIRVIAILQRKDIKSLMEEAGIDRQTFYNSEKRGSIETDKLIRIAEVLGVDVKVLFTDVNGNLLKSIEKMNSFASESQPLQQ